MIKHLLLSNACLFYCKLVDIIENVDIIGWYYLIIENTVLGEICFKEIVCVSELEPFPTCLVWYHITTDPMHLLIIVFRIALMVSLT